MFPFALIVFFFTDILPWLAPLAVSGVTGGLGGFGSFRFAQGATTQRISTLERDVTQMQHERGEYLTRNEFELLREDLREIKADMREVRRSLSK